jgi:hypothetical protein
MVTVTITATDQTNPQNSNTLGVLQYSFQLFQRQPITPSPKALLPKITSGVTVATGIFSNYADHTVTVVFDNKTNNRTITIKRSS